MTRGRRGRWGALMADSPERAALRQAGRAWPHLARLARLDIARRAWLDAGRPGPRPEVEAPAALDLGPEARAARKAQNAAILALVEAG